MAAQVDAMAELQATFKRLFEKKNWMLALPILVGYVVSFIVFLIVAAVSLGPAIVTTFFGAAGAGSGSDIGSLGALFGTAGIMFVLGIIVAVFVAFIIGVFSYGWAYAAAEPVWHGGDPDIGGGLSKAMSKFGSLAVAGVILALVVGLLGWTFIVPLLVGLFCLYIIPYIMQGNESGTGAIGASIRLSRENMGPTALLFVGLIVVGIAAGIVNVVLGLIPILGHLASLAVISLCAAFGILAIMRFYALLTGSSTAAAAPPATTV